MSACRARSSSAANSSSLTFVPMDLVRSGGLHRAPPVRLCWGFGPHAASAPQRTGHGAVPSRFLAKGRGVIGLPLQQPQVATRVTRFQEILPLRFSATTLALRASPPYPYSRWLRPEPPKIGAVALVMWNMRRRHSSHSCQPAAAEPSVKAVRSDAAQRSERSGEPLRTAERRLHARERAGMPVPASRFVLSTGSPSGSRRLLPQ